MKNERQTQLAEAARPEPAVLMHVCCCSPLVPVATTANTYLPHMRCQICGTIYGIDGDEKFPCENPDRHCEGIAQGLRIPDAARWAR